MKKRIIALALCAVMCLTLLPVTALAAQRPACRLAKRGISSVHYVVYEYGDGLEIDSRNVSYKLNYDAWQRMSESDRMTVVRHFAGFNPQMFLQFGRSNGQAMLEYALEKSGWKDAGAKLRTKLAARDYPTLLNFFGPPDNPKDPPGLGIDLNEIRYCAEEKAALVEKIGDYTMTYQEGVSAWQKLMHLKQNQTNAAVTAVSSGLIQVILDNMAPPTRKRPSMTTTEISTSRWRKTRIRGTTTSTTGLSPICWSRRSLLLRRRCCLTASPTRWPSWA